MAIETREMLENPSMNGTEPQDVTSKVERVTPEMAAIWLATDLYEHQRPLRDWHIKEYAVEMGAGRFTPGTTLKFGVLSGRRHLIDGQHRLHAVIAAEIPQTFVVTEIGFATMEDLERAYGREDTGLRRLAREAPYFHSYAERHGFAPADVNKLVAAMPILIRGFQLKSGHHGPVPTERYAEVAAPLAGPFRSYLAATKHRPRAMARYLALGGVIAVGLVTFRDQPERAKPFWERVAAISGYERGSGEAFLVGFFLEKTFTRLLGAEISRYVARAWTAYYEGESIQVYRTPDLSRPIRIAGTSYDGRNVRTL